VHKALAPEHNIGLPLSVRLGHAITHITAAIYAHALEKDELGRDLLLSFCR
jgi:hypothetical protein